MTISWSRIGEPLSIALAALLLAPAAAPAQSPVAWQVDSVCGYFDWDEDGAVDHTRLTYNVLNTSPPGDANNLCTFTLYAGSDQGVWLARHPEGWLADILADRTVFRGNGNYIAPNYGTHNFELYSLYTGLAPGAAEAASGFNGPFPVLTVTLPAPRPASLAAAAPVSVGSGTNRVTLAVSSPDAPSFQLQYTDTLAPTNWNDLARVAVTGAVTLATDTNTAPSRFYRALVP